MIKKYLCAVVTVILVLACVSSIFTPVFAADESFVMEVLRWKSDTDSHEAMPSAGLDEGDVITVYIKTPVSLSAVAGLNFTLEYNTEYFKYLAVAEESLIADGNGQFNTNANTAGKIAAVWDTTKAGGTNTSATLPLFCFRFTVIKSPAASTDTVFTMTVNQIYNAGYQLIDIVPATKKYTTTVKLNAPGIDTAALNKLLIAIGKLQNITADSLPDIINAEMLFNGLSNKEKTWLYQTYPSEYALFSTARSRYYEKVENASDEEFLQQLQNFLTDYADVLTLTREEVLGQIKGKSLSEATAILTAQLNEVDLVLGIYKSMPARMKTMMDTNTKNKLSLLSDMSVDLLLGMEGIDVFSQNVTMNAALALNPALIESEFKREALTLVGEALTYYAGTLWLTQGYYTNEKQTLDTLKAILDRQLDEMDAAQAALERAIQKEIEDFQKKYSDIFDLTFQNVSIGDETRISDALDDLMNLMPETREQLADKRERFENLLLLIGAMKGTKNTVNENDTIITNTITEKEIVTETNTVTETKYVEGETVTSPPVLLEKLFEKDTAALIWWLLGLLGASLLSLIYPAVMMSKAKKAARERGYLL